MLRKIDKDTLFFGVIGYPVGHSRSPRLFNALFDEYKINGVYRYIETKELEKAMLGLRGLNYRGLSITIPHKEEAIKYVDFLSPLAQKLGCINTVINENGILTGYNFDGIGAGEALTEFSKKWEEKNILIIGTGGAARGIAMSFIIEYGLKKIIFLSGSKNENRLYKETSRLIDAEIYSYEEVQTLFEKEQIDVIINTTPVGMEPRVDESPLDKHFLKGRLVFDIVYTPEETKFLRDAREQGCEAIYGKQMFIGQALRQFELWCAIKADRRKALSFIE